MEEDGDDDDEDGDDDEDDGDDDGDDDCSDDNDGRRRRQIWLIAQCSYNTSSAQPSLFLCAPKLMEMTRKKHIFFE